MAKKVISFVAAAAVTLIVCACVGIGVQSSLAVCGMAIAFTLLASKIVEDVSDGTMPSWQTWTVYALSFLATVLYGVGMKVGSVPVLIACGVCVALGVLFYYIGKKEAKKGE